MLSLLEYKHAILKNQALCYVQSHVFARYFTLCHFSNCNCYQDTIIAMEALLEFSRLSGYQDFDIDVGLEAQNDSDWKYNFHMDRTNYTEWQHISVS